MPVEGIDLQVLLAPLGDDTPTGIDVRTDFSPTSSYFRLRDARAEARAAERAADANPGGDNTAPESWREVRRLAAKILSEQAKDLEVGAWLTEALVRSDGLAGLAFGAELLAGLATRYWDQLYPMPDEDGMETRVAPVTGLNGEGGDGTLSQPLLKLPLFNDANGEPVLLYQYEQSAELAALSDPARVEARIKAGVMPYDKMQAAARAAPASCYARLRQDLRAAQSAWNALDAAYTAAAGADSPPTRRISDTLEKISTIIALAHAPAPAAALDDEDALAETGGADAAPGRPRRRGAWRHARMPLPA